MGAIYQIWDDSDDFHQDAAAASFLGARWRTSVARERDEIFERRYDFLVRTDMSEFCTKFGKI